MARRRSRRATRAVSSYGAPAAELRRQARESVSWASRTTASVDETTVLVDGDPATSGLGAGDQPACSVQGLGVRCQDLVDDAGPARGCTAVRERNPRSASCRVLVSRTRRGHGSRSRSAPPGHRDRRPPRVGRSRAGCCPRPPVSLSCGAPAGPPAGRPPRRRRNAPAGAATSSGSDTSVDADSMSATTPSGADSASGRLEPGQLRVDLRHHFAGRLGHEEARDGRMDDRLQVRDDVLGARPAPTPRRRPGAGPAPATAAPGRGPPPCPGEARRPRGRARWRPPRRGAPSRRGRGRDPGT